MLLFPSRSCLLHLASLPFAQTFTAAVFAGNKMPVTEITPHTYNATRQLENPPLVAVLGLCLISIIYLSPKHSDVSFPSCFC